eukprot:12250461-Alexandrium_andersonii.AAC.1
MSNAFFCGDHSCLDSAAWKALRACDYRLYVERHCSAVLQLRPSTAEPPLELSVASGAPPGDGNASEQFKDVFHPRVVQWLQKSTQHCIWASIPWDPCLLYTSPSPRD